MRSVTPVLLVLSMVLLGACTDDGGLLVEDDATTDAGDGGQGTGDAAAGEMTVSDLCSDVVAALEDMTDSLGDINSVPDLDTITDVLGDNAEELESLSQRVDDVSVEGEDEQAVVDALEEAMASARAAADAAADDDLTGVQSELDELTGQLGEARDAAQAADVDCSS